MKTFYTFILIMMSSAAALCQDTFRGTARDENGQPLVRAQVRVYDANENLLTTTFTDADGKFVTDIEIGRVTGIDDPWSENHYLSLVYPNPASKGPIHFKYRSITGEPPHIIFYTFKGERIHAGSTISAGTYIYKATFTGTEKKVFSGLSSVLSSMKLEVQLQDISKQQGDKTASSKDNSAARLKAEQVRIEILKDGYITLSEEVDLSNTENGDQTYSLNTAEKPTADFQVIADDGQNERDLIKFDASASAGANGESLTYAWSFGDGSRSGQVQIPHIYPTADSYSVTLTVVGAYGATQSVTKDINIAAKSSPTGIAAIRGIVSDVQGNPLEGVSVQVPHMDTIYMTTSDGEVGFDGFVSGQPRMIILSKPGYVAEHYPLDILADSRQGYFELSLIKQEPAIVIASAELGGVAAGKDGGTVQLPVEGLMHEDGRIVTGDVEVFVTPIDISDDRALEAFPGNFSGITFEGVAPLIMTYGTADYTFMQNGEELQLVSGKTATIEIPIYADVNELGESLSEGDEFPLWYYAEASGEWVNEGNGTVVASNESPTGLALRGEVTHFSWWNCDIAPNPWYANPECKTKDKNGNPTLDIPNRGACFISGRRELPAGPRANPSTPNCCQPLPSPPGVPIVFNGTGGNGIYSGSTTASGAAGTTSTVIIIMEPVAGFGELAGEIAPDTVFTTAIEEEGAIDAFRVNQKIGKTMMLVVAPGENSSLEGLVEVRDPDNLLLVKRAFNGTSTFGSLVEIKKIGDYQIKIDGTSNEPGTYKLSLTSSRAITLNSNTEDSQVLPRGTRTFAFELDSGQVYNVAVASSIIGRSYLNLYSPAGEQIMQTSGTSYIQTGVRHAEESGVYRVEIEGIDDNSNGNFTIGLSSVELIPINFSAPFVAIDGTIDIIGRRHYYSMNVDSLERINFGLKLEEAIQYSFFLRMEANKLFYEKEKFFFEAYTSAYTSAESGILTMPFGGQLVFEVYPNQSKAEIGRTFKIYIGKRVVTPIDLNTKSSGSISLDLGVFHQFHQYKITSPPSNKISIDFAWDSPPTGLGRTYISVFTTEGEQLYSDRVYESGIISLPSSGEYIIEIASVDNNEGTFSLIVNAE